MERQLQFLVAAAQRESSLAPPPKQARKIRRGRRISFLKEPLGSPQLLRRPGLSRKCYYPAGKALA